MFDCKTFLGDETGAVTVDWVVLTAGVVVLAVFAVPPIRTAMIDVATGIGENVIASDQFFE